MSKKHLIIVESPAKAKKIANFLGSDYTVMATQGHIADLAKGGLHGIGVDVTNNFKPKYTLMDDKVKIVDGLIGASENSDEILIASDPDREGEAIAWHIFQRIGCSDKSVSRVEFHEITKKGVENGLSKKREINLDLFKSQETRRILDRIVGFMTSPFLINVFDQRLSAGRVQSVVTKMIIDRENEIKSFTPSQYWVVKLNLQTNLNDIISVKYDGKIDSESDALAIKKDVLKDNSYFTVSDIDFSDEIKRQPPPMITAELQRVMSKSFGFSADRTMKAAQSLYENGYVTYIRTDSHRVDDDALKDLISWLRANGHEVPKSPVKHKTKKSSQDAHECIRPTDITLGPDNPELIGDEKKVYDIIWKYFVASQMSPAIFSSVKITVKNSINKNLVFKSSGKTLKSKGFLSIIGNYNIDNTELPNIAKGDRLNLASDSGFICEKKFTQPPTRFSTDTLIKSMEQNNIGRPATYSEILSKITSRKYVELDGKFFKPTDLGNKVTECLDNFFSFMNYDYTVMMEHALDEIASGKLSRDTMLNDFFTSFSSELKRAYQSSGKIICEDCGGFMLKKKSKSEKYFMGCSNFPRCRKIIQIDDVS